MTLPLLTFSWPFRSVDGVAPAQVTEEEAILESIKRLLLTPRGQRAMRRRIGSTALRYVFEPNDPVLAETLRFDVLQTLRAEPRIIVTRVEPLRRESEITLQIDYAIRSTGATASAAVSLGTASISP